MKNPVESEGRLFIVATPIGNLKDITERARETLEKVDVIFCESLKKGRVLLNALGIRKRLSVLNNKNERKKVEDLIRFLNMGKDVALITDSGTPGISDPGYLPVKKAIDNGYPVIPIPGPSSIMALLSVSGLPTEKFYFEGFLPKSRAKKQKRLEYLLSLDCTFVFFESPHRVLETLGIIASESPRRRMALGREMTKVHEEIIRGDAEGIYDSLKRRERIKGEITIAVAPEGYGG